MDIQTSLYKANSIVLAPIDHEKDPEVESQWTHDPEYLRMLDSRPAQPRSVAQVKKAYEKIEKDAEESKSFFHFMIRTRLLSSDVRAESEADLENTPDPGRLVGFIQLYWIEWNHGTGFVRLGIGSLEDRRKGYGSEALRLILRYAFRELNLYRLAAMIPAYNQPALSLFRCAGFVEEVCRRKALHLDGRAWDLIHMGILREEWETQVREGG
jgi:RimJ/RimL family protein N-acetyltransferase